MDAGREGSAGPRGKRQRHAAVVPGPWTKHYDSYRRSCQDRSSRRKITSFSDTLDLNSLGMLEELGARTFAGSFADHDSQRPRQLCSFDKSCARALRRSRMGFIDSPKSSSKSAVVSVTRMLLLLPLVLVMLPALAFAASSRTFFSSSDGDSDSQMASAVGGQPDMEVDGLPRYHSQRNKYDTNSIVGRRCSREGTDQGCPPNYTCHSFLEDAGQFEVFDSRCIEWAGWGKDWVHCWSARWV